MRVSSRYAAVLAAVTSSVIAAAAAASDHPPTPVSPPPPHTGCCGHGNGPHVRPPSIHIGGTNVHVGGTHVNVGGVHVNNHVNLHVDNSLNVNINNTINNNLSNDVSIVNNVGGAGSASARASAQNFALLNNSTSVLGGGGGYVMSGAPSAATAVNLNLAASAESRVELVEEERTRWVEGWRVVRAVCMDDGGTPHPASRPDEGERVDRHYEGEIFRCMAGTAMHVTLGAIDTGSGSSGQGESFSCRKGEALRHRAGGAVSCAPEEARRNCNERSLLRRWGPGVKYIYARYEERYTETVERRVAAQASAQASGLVLMLDGGVGGYR
ncbi:MAG: hypothetical protein AAFX09_06825 [Pseudomonadota bacterium]